MRISWIARERWLSRGSSEEQNTGMIQSVLEFCAELFCSVATRKVTGDLQIVVALCLCLRACGFQYSVFEFSVRPAWFYPVLRPALLSIKSSLNILRSICLYKYFESFNPLCDFSPPLFMESSRNQYLCTCALFIPSLTIELPSPHRLRTYWALMISYLCCVFNIRFAYFHRLFTSWVIALHYRNPGHVVSSMTGYCSPFRPWLQISKLQPTAFLSWNLVGSMTGTAAR